MVWSSSRCKNRYKVVKWGHIGDSERLTQFAVLTQTYLGFAKRPVFVTHQTENRQQLGLPEAKNTSRGAGFLTPIRPD